MRAKHEAGQAFCTHAAKGLQSVCESDDAILSQAIEANELACTNALQWNAALSLSLATETQATLKIQKQTGLACDRATKALAMELVEFGQDLKNHATEWTKEVRLLLL
jgi:hypothetical protein